VTRFGKSKKKSAVVNAQRKRSRVGRRMRKKRRNLLKENPGIDNNTVVILPTWEGKLP